jgi:putative resolvase
VGAGPGGFVPDGLNWFRAGTLPGSAHQLPTGTIVVEPSAEPSGRTVAYCRVSSADQRAEVGRQAGRVAQEAGKRITLDATVTGVGSGVNGNRATLRKVLADPQVRGIVVEHRDRLARFGVERRRAEAGVRCVTAEVVAVVAQ